MDAEEKRQRLANKVKVNLAMTVREIFDQIEEDRSRPKAMAYFDRIFKTFAEGGVGAVPKEKGRKIIGTYCLFVPEEIIYAAGAQPVRLCAGSYDSVEVGEDYLPDVACPMVKSEVGFSTLPVLSFYQDCDLVVIPASCDWKTKMGNFIEAHVPVLMLDMPRVKESEASREMWLNQIKDFKTRVEKVTGTRITRRRMREAIRMIQKAQVQFDRFHEIRKADTTVIHGRDALEVLNAYFYDHVESWTAAMARLNDELEERVRDKVNVANPLAARLMLTGSPMVFPNWKIPTVIEELGGVLAADEFCTSNRYLHDKVAVDEGLMSDMLHAIADRYLLPCSCPIFSNTVDRCDRLLQLVEDYRIEGVIYHTLKGCHPYDLETKLVETLLQDNGIPMLKIETDYSPQDVEQLRTRIEAFMETLKGKRHT
ncbi:MAG: double-cubane-cluster-containing anaerobic reductase [Rhodospirillales bacterium]|nr:double-cubane-cluster-containing anaerobic reductase [Rhodospirillales bacterium]MCW8953158.1 double-cubane-cluster-containing anaerobic reductase [Rhodospirillales bacterium]MCW9002422.1 double-cubane-cluster-containing anaerobic reductase [Rhodospirillales bacterium]